MTEPHRWMEFAREDFVLAEAALEKGIYNQTCFHAQQGVEKALKGFLRSRQRSVPRSHALGELLAICQDLDASFSKLQETCLKLDQYYIPTRYPDALPGIGPEGLPTRQDAEDVAALLRNTLDWIESKIHG